MRGTFKDNRYIKHEKEKGILRFCNAWSINMNECSREKMASLDRIIFITEKAEYVIDAGIALEKGFYRNLGGEDKWIVPIKNWQVNEVSSTV